MSRTDAHTPWAIAQDRAHAKYQPAPRQIACRVPPAGASYASTPRQKRQWVVEERAGVLPASHRIEQEALVNDHRWGYGEYLRMMAQRRDERQAPTVQEAVRDMLAIDHEDVVETGLGTLPTVDRWWYANRKRTSPELENLQALDELRRDRILTSRPGTPIEYNPDTIRWQQEAEDSVWYQEIVERAAERAAERTEQEDAEYEDFATLMAEIPGYGPAKQGEVKDSKGRTINGFGCSGNWTWESTLTFTGA